LVKATLYPPLLRVFDAALYVGQHSRRYYEHYGYPKRRLFFAPHCIDTAWFRSRATSDVRYQLRNALGIGAQDKVLLFAGKFEPFKRPIDVIEAVAQLGLEQPVHVMMAGAGVLESSIRARASALGVSLHMLGFQNQSQMPGVYAASDVLVLPSGGRETWGLVANEALACGLPVIVSDAVGCAPDLAGDGTVGAVTRLGDIESLSKSMVRLLKAPPALTDIHRRSEEFSVDRAVSGICEAAEFVCGR
jgi:glycosyltransferase involved in cell wall biosynthesis